MTDHSTHDKSRDKKKIAVEFERPSNAAEDPAQGAGDPEPQKDKGSGEVAALDPLARLQAEKDELTQTMIRRQADFENYRKRVERERQEEQRRGVGRVIEELLPVLDAFSNALKAYGDPQFEEYRKGLELIYRRTWDVLARHGLERIAAEGKTFDPHFHQAIERVESCELADDTVVDVLQDGYLYHGRVLRPSAVRVAVHTEAAAEGRGR
jgi:molecular chaperone GrpE